MDTFDTPDFPSIFLNGAITGELGHADGIEDGLSSPGDGVDKVALGAGGGIEIGREIGKMEVTISVMDDGVEKPAEEVRLFRGEDAGYESVHGALEARILPIEGGRIVEALITHGFEFFHGAAEDVDILFASFLHDLNVGAVERAQRERAVDRELHIAGTGCFHSGGGDLLADVGGGHDDFGERNAVVGDEDDFQAIFDASVIVDEIADAVDELDDLLGGPISGRCFAREDISARREGVFGVFDEALVFGDDAEHVQRLPLVFVDALDLHVEDGTGIDVGAGGLANDISQTDFVLLLDGEELTAERGVVGEALKFAEAADIGDPFVADGIGVESRESRI